MIQLPVPFIIYWLVVKDFFYDLDNCNNNFNETGYCLSDLQCNTLVEGKNIGSCDSEASGTVCCKITLNYFNETYLLAPIFVQKSQTDVIQEKTIVNANKCSKFQTIYGEKIITSDRKKKMVQFDPDIHVSKSPDKIMWAISASYSRESRDLEKQSSGQNVLYAVILDKENATSECLSESDASKDEKLLNINVVNFPIRKFFTPEIQKLNTRNLTVDAKSLFETQPDKRIRRSVHHSSCNEEDSACRKQEWEDIVNVVTEEEIVIIQTDQDMQNQNKTLKYHENIDSVRNYMLDSKSMLNELTENKDMDKKSSNDILNNGEITSLIQGTEESVYDSTEVNTYDSDVKNTVEVQRPSVSFKEDSVSVEKDIYEVKGDLETDVDDNRSVDYPAVHNMRQPMLIKTSQFISYHVQAEATNDRRKSVKVGAIYDLKKPLQTIDVHDLRIPVQVEATHDSRKVVQQESTHNMRIPVQMHTYHNMQKPVQTLREPVKSEMTHDLRKPVPFDESHDLRWPVIEGETDLRNLATDSESSNKQDGRSKLCANKNANLFKSLNDCIVTSLSDKSTTLNSSYGRKQKQFDIWKEASKVCGNYSEDATENIRKVKETWPWMVSLHENVSGTSSHRCSASLLNSFWAVTVAHCVDMKPKSDLKLIMGSKTPEHDRENYAEVDIDEILIHPKFNRGLFENDIALLRLKTPAAFQSTILPICLPWSVGELMYGTPVFLNRELKHQRSYEDLEKFAVPVMPNYECEILYSTGKNKEKIKDTFLCAAKDDENCDSESGSSLIALDAKGRWSLIGLVSWGSMCTNLEQPAVYTRISSYAQWIKDVIDCYESLL